MPALRSCLALVLAFGLGPASASAQWVFRTIGEKTQVVPPSASNASCSGTFFFAPNSNLLVYSVVPANLGADTLTSAELRSGLPGANGGLIATLTKVGNVFSGTTPALTANQVAMITGNTTHVIVKTQTYPNGAVRGQVATGWYQFWMTGDALQLIPPQALPATCFGTFKLSPTNLLAYEVVAQNLVGNPTHCHIVDAPAGVNGPVLHALAMTAPAVWTGNVQLTPVQAAKLRTQQLSIIVRSNAFVTGECRGPMKATSTDCGSGCPSTKGLCALDVGGHAYPGGSVTVTVVGAKANAPGVLMMNTDWLNLKYKDACYLYVKQPPPVVIPLTSNAQGTISIPNVPVPPLPGPLRAFLQYAGADNGVPAKFYMSNGNVLSL